MYKLDVEGLRLKVIRDNIKIIDAGGSDFDVAMTRREMRCELRVKPPILTLKFMLGGG